MDIALIKILEYYDQTFRDNDIIAVKFNCVDEDEELIEEEFTGRLDDILENAIVLDTSEKYNSEMIYIFYEDIIDIMEV